MSLKHFLTHTLLKSNSVCYYKLNSSSLNEFYTKLLFSGGELSGLCAQILSVCIIFYYLLLILKSECNIALFYWS